MKQANILPMTKEAALDEQQLAGIREQYPNATEEQLAHAATLNSDDTPVVQELKEWERSLDGGVLATFNEVFAGMAEKDPLAFAQELARDWGYDIEGSPVYTDEANDRNRYAFLVSSKLEALARDLLTVIDPESEGEAAQTAFDSWLQKQNVDMSSPTNQAILSELVQRYQATTGVTLALQASTKRMTRKAWSDPFNYIDVAPIDYVFGLAKQTKGPLTAERLREALEEDSHRNHGDSVPLDYAQDLLNKAKARFASKRKADWYSKKQLQKERGPRQYDMSKKPESLSSYLEANVVPVMAQQDPQETLKALADGIQRAGEAGLLSPNKQRSIFRDAQVALEAKGKEGLWGHITNLTLKGEGLGMTPQRRWAAGPRSYVDVPLKDIDCPKCATSFQADPNPKSVATCPSCGYDIYPTERTAQRRWAAGGTYWSSDGPPGSGNSMVDGADEELDRRDRSATEERQARRSFEEKLAEDLRIPEEDAYDWAEIFYEDMGEWERNFETIVEWIKEGFTAEQASYWKAEVGSDVSEVKAYMSENEVGRAGQRMASFDEELVARLTRKAYDPADSLKPMTWVVQHNEDAVAEEFMHEEKLEGEDAEEEEESGEGDTIKIEVDPETHKVEVDFGDEEQGEDEEEAEEPKQVAPKSKEEAPNEKDPKNLNKADEADQVNY